MILSSSPFPAEGDLALGSLALSPAGCGLRSECVSMPVCAEWGEEEGETKVRGAKSQTDKNHPGVALSSLQEIQWGWKSSVQEVEDPRFNSNWSVP